MLDVMYIPSRGSRDTPERLPGVQGSKRTQSFIREQGSCFWDTFEALEFLLIKGALTKHLKLFIT